MFKVNASEVRYIQKRAAIFTKISNEIQRIAGTTELKNIELPVVCVKGVWEHEGVAGILIVTEARHKGFQAQMMVHSDTREKYLEISWEPINDGEDLEDAK